MAPAFLFPCCPHNLLIAFALFRRRGVPQQHFIDMISTQSLSAGCLAAQAAPCRRIRRTQPPTRRMQPMLASAGHQAGGAGPTEPCRKKVAFQQTGGCTLHVEHVTQAVLDWCLDEQGAVGFATADGFISADLADLPEGGRVRLMYMEDVRNMLNEVRPCFCWLGLHI